jgi:hypothetical protein
MIPDEEIDRLTDAVDAAIGLAACGLLADGDAVLLDGLEQPDLLCLATPIAVRLG